MTINKSVAILLVAVLILAAVVVSPEKSSKVEAQSSREFSGEEYFAGLMFGHGEVGELVSSQIEDKSIISQANTPQGKETISDIETFIKKEDSTYFNELETSIENNDPKKLVDNMIRGEELLASYAEQSEDAKLESSEGEFNTAACGVVAGCVVAVGGYMYIVLVNGAAVQTAAAITTAVWLKVAKYSSSAKSSHVETAAVETLKLLN